MDADCNSLGIPCHLHSCGQPPLPFTDHDELLFRHYNLNDVIPGDELSLVTRISFDSKGSSSNRSSLSSPEDVLIDCDKGVCNLGRGILTFPAMAMEGKEWILKDPPRGTKSPVFVLSVIHSPTKCNYAHSDFEIKKDGSPVANIKPSSIKEMIRFYLKEITKSI